MTVATPDSQEGFGTRIQDLSAIASIAGEDLVEIIDDPSGTPASRKATITQMAIFLNNSPTLVTPALGTVASGDISACTSTSMVMVTPLLGTPTSGVISNCTSTSMVLTTPVLGTPTSGVLTNCTGLPTGGVAATLDAKTLTDTVRIQNALATALGTTGTIDLDFSTGELTTMPAMTGNVTFTTSNLGIGKSKTIRIIGGASAYTFTFPAWKFLGAAAPASLAIGKYAVLTLTSISTTDAEVVAAYSVQV